MKISVYPQKASLSDALKNQIFSAYITVSTKNLAEKIAFVLVSERLAACVNVFPVSSVYQWKGAVEKVKEYAIIAKTERALFPRLEKRVKSMHSDAVPCIVALPIVAGNKEYLKWVRKETV